MDIHQIRYFEALAKTLNYTTAAKECFISRQALRQTVQALEKEYGVTLVLNRRNKLCLTPAGELLAANAGKVLSAYDKLDKTMRDFVSEKRTLRLGISISLLPFYAPELMKLISELDEPFPGIVIERTLSDADSLLKRLKAGDLDAAILVDMGIEITGMQRTVLRKDEMGLLLSVDHPLASRSSLSLTDLEGQTISLMSAPALCFLPLAEALQERGVKVNFRTIPESIEAFQAVRREGILSIDRMAEEGKAPVALEIDRTLSDFKHDLETAMLVRESVAREYRMLVDYLVKAMSEGKE